MVSVNQIRKHFHRAIGGFVGPSLRCPGGMQFRLFYEDSKRLGITMSAFQLKSFKDDDALMAELVLRFKKLEDLIILGKGDESKHRT